MDPDAQPGQQGRQMLEDKLRLYLYWKARLSVRSAGSQPPPAANHQSTPGDEELNPALRKKDRDRAERAASRRRVRGGTPSTVSVRAQGPDQGSAAPLEEEGILAELYVCSSRQLRPAVNVSQSLNSGEHVRRYRTRPGVVIGSVTAT